MTKMRAKLRSNKGASITFALLLFLVCAMVSSVVIVAATASAGRLSEIAKTDRRYYAVNSAAELLCDVLVGAEPVTVTYQKGAEGSLTGTVISTQSTSTDTLVLYAAENMAAALAGYPPSPRTAYKAIELTSTVGDGALDCSIIDSYASNGLLVFTIKNKTTETDTSVYTIKLTLASSVKVTQISTDTTQYEITWKLHSIKRGRADDPTT